MSDEKKTESKVESGPAHLSPAVTATVEKAPEPAKVQPAPAATQATAKPAATPQGTPQASPVATLKPTTDKPPESHLGSKAYLHELVEFEKQLDEDTSRSYDGNIIAHQAKFAVLKVTVESDPRATDDERAIVGSLQKKVARLAIPRSYGAQLNDVRNRLDEAVARNDGSGKNEARQDFAALKAKMESDGNITSSERQALDAMDRRVSSIQYTG